MTNGEARSWNFESRHRFVLPFVIRHLSFPRYHGVNLNPNRLNTFSPSKPRPVAANGQNQSTGSGADGFSLVGFIASILLNTSRSAAGSSAANAAPPVRFAMVNVSS